MKLSIIVPVYNEEATIEKILRKLDQLDLEKEIIVVNDGSRDKTWEKIEGLRASIPSLKCVNLERNSGKGKAIREGLKQVRGDLVAIQDADLEYDPHDLLKLISELERRGADVAYGIRQFKGGGSPIWHRLVNRLLSLLTSLIYFSNIKDMETCYKLMPAQVWKSLKLKSDRFEIEAEITAKVLRSKYKIVQVPISYSFRRYSEGKKISWLDGLKTLYVLVKYRLFY